MPAAIPAAAAIGGALISSNGAKSAAKTQAQAIENANKQDPRIEARLYGTNGQNGLLDRFQGLLDAPQSEAMKGFTQAAGSYLGNAGADFNAMRGAANGLLNPTNAPQAAAAQMTGTPQMTAAQAGPAALSQGAPQVVAHGQGDVLWNKGETFSAPQAMQAAQVQQPNAMAAAQAAGVQMNAPAQNGMDLTGSYNRFINGTPGANPYLDQSISGAIAMNRLGFNQLQDDATENLMKNVMPSIRSNAVLAGQYGGSRQGVAEGNSIGQLGKEMARAGAQFAQNATNAAVGAKANAYESDSNRALAATQGLGAQQYGAAQTNAGLAQQTQLSNQQANQQANATNFGGQLTGALANASAQNNAAQTNYAGQLQTNQQNAANLQQANLANQAVGNNAAQFGAAQSQAASLANAQLGLNNNQFNAGQINNTNQFNAGLTQGANQFNTGLLQQTGLANLGNQQQTNLANLQSLLSTNGLNSNNAQAGIGALSGLLGTAAGVTQAGDSYDINRAQQVNGLLAPYLTRNPSGQVAPAANTGAAGLGGAMAGFGLANQFMGLGGGKSTQFDGASMGSFGDLFGKGGFGTSGGYF